MVDILSFSSRRRIKTSLGHTLYGLSGNIVQFLFSVIVVRFFSGQLWGSFTQLFLLVAVLNMFTGWGNKDYLLREFSRNGQLSEFWQTSFLSRLLVLLPLLPFVVFLEIASSNPWLVSSWLVAVFFYRSFDSVIVFERKFKEAIGIELAGLLALSLLMFGWNGVITINSILLFFVLVTLLKGGLCVWMFRTTLFGSWKGRVDVRHLILSLPYFLPPFIGFFQAKADTFVIAIKLSKEELGEYYILINLLSYCHTFAVLAITPFLKNIYRINWASLQKIKRTVLLAGLPWSLVCIVGIYFVMELIYRIHLPVDDYLIGWLALPPYFVYFLLMQQFIRKDKPYFIVVINSASAVLNFITSFVLIEYAGFRGGLIACASMQWALMIGFLIIGKEKQSSSQA